MRARLAVLTAVAALLLSITPSYAGTTYKVVGRASFGADANGPAAEVFIRQLANGRSSVTLRATGLAPGSQPVWRAFSNDRCAPGGTELITSAPMTVTQAGTALSVVPDMQAVPLGSGAPAWIAVRLYESTTGAELGCGQVKDMPYSVYESAHWW